MHCRMSHRRPTLTGVLGYSLWLIGGVESLVLESIQWCVWLFRPSSPFAVATPWIFVCLFV